MNCPGAGGTLHQPHQHQSSACAWPAPMPIDANLSAPATAAPAANLFSFIVNSSNQLAALPPPTTSACRTLAKTARRSRLFPVSISAHGLRSLAISTVPLRLLDRAPPDCDHQASSAALLRP